MPKTCIVIPSEDMVHADAASCWLMLQHYCLVKDIRHALVNTKCSRSVDVGRNNGVSAALQVESTHLFFIDSDMMFPPDTLERLLKHDMPFDLTHRELDGGPGTILNQPLREISRLATGCMLIDMKVIAALKKPYFHALWNEGTAECISEDNVFCDKARAAGFSVWLDEGLSKEIRHLGQNAYTLQDAVLPKPKLKLVDYA
jgi:hypothetical protein